MKQWYSARELVGLPGMPSARENIARKAKVESWKFRQRSGRGGGREYAIESLPQVTQAVLSASNLDPPDSVSVLEKPSSVRGVLWTEHELDRAPVFPAQTVSTVAPTEIAAQAIANHSSRNSKHFTNVKTSERKTG